MFNSEIVSIKLLGNDYGLILNSIRLRDGNRDCLNAVNRSIQTLDDKINYSRYSNCKSLISTLIYVF